MERTKLINFCDKTALFSLYGVAYFLPISKAIIEILIYLSIAAFLVKKILQRQFLPKTKINLAVFSYIIICFFSIFISSNPKISTRAFLGKVLQDLTFFFVVIDVLNSQRRLKNVLYIIFASSFLLGIDGIYQHFMHKEFIRNRPYELPRVHATFSTGNDFGCYLITIMPFTVVCFFDKFNFRKLFRFLFLGLFILLFTCLMLTVSRGAWFGFIASLLFVSIWIKAMGLFFLVLGIFIIATHQFYAPLLKDRLANFFVFSDNSSVDRNMIWEIAGRMFMRRPLIGLGLGTFMFNFSKFAAGGYPYSIPYAHNCYLQIAAEIGIFGLVSFLSILILFFSYGIDLIVTRQKTFFWYVLLASLAAILAYSIQMTVDTSLYSLDLGALFWFTLGLGVAAMKGIETE
ncbi:MAG: O-antigen ligase family protein [Candidatus Omnitrophota bacterium]